VCLPIQIVYTHFSTQPIVMLEVSERR